MIVRVKKKIRFSVISNAPLNDQRLSWETRGLLAWILTKPDHWIIKSQAIINQGNAGRDKVARMMSELEEFGYLLRAKRRSEHGQFEWEVVVYEEPIAHQRGDQATAGCSVGVAANRSTAQPSMAEPDSSKPAIDNLHIVNTERSRTEVSSTEEFKTERSHTQNTARELAARSQKSCEVVASDKEVENIFELAWRSYPKRAGANSEVAALREWQRTIARHRKLEGAAFDLLLLKSEMLAGVKRYGNFAHQSAEAGTRFVMQAKNFFGPDEHWRNAWEPDRTLGMSVGMRKLTLASEETKRTEGEREFDVEITSKACTHGSCPSDVCRYVDGYETPRRSGLSSISDVIPRVQDKLGKPTC